MMFHRAVLTLVMASMSLSAHAEGTQAQPHWGYTGEADPAHWGELSDSFEACGRGQAQSPIDIQDAAAIQAVLPDLKFHYKPFPLELVNNGHSIQVSGVSEDGFAVENHTFDLVQFHFHSPSEYHLNGKTYPLELHMVHKRDDGALAVVAVMFEAGEANPALEAVFAHLPQTAGAPQKVANVSVDMNAFLPTDRHYYRLMGSLTTPPCSEGVNWYVLETPMTASQAQIDAFAHLFPEGDARPLQAANSRLIVKGMN